MFRLWKSLVVALLALALLATACGSGSNTATAEPTGDPDSTSIDDTRDSTPVEAVDGDGAGDEGDPDLSAGSGGTSSGSGGIGATAGISFRSRLQPFAECGAYLDHIKAEALERVGPWGLDGQGYFGGPMSMGGAMMEDDMMVMEAEGAATDTVEQSAAMESFAADDGADASAASAPGLALTGPGDEGGGNFSGTNVQVDGVDEPDIVKTDGNRIITLRGQTLDVVDVTQPDPTITSTIELPIWGRDMLLFGDTVLVMGNDWGGLIAEPFLASSSTGDAEEDFASDAIVPNYEGEGGGPITTVTQVSIGASPRIISTMRLDGNFVNARMIGDIVRVVISSPPPNIGWVFPQSQNTEDIAEQANRSIIEQSALSDWLPSYSITDENNTTTSGDLLACNEMHRPTEFAGFSTLSVLTLDIDGPLALSGATGVLADGQTVYASTNSLYVGTTVWENDLLSQDVAPDQWNESWSTSLHRFDITDPTRASYVASGSVPGSMLSQFSMHEWDGRLFVATTEGAPWGFQETSESFITVLEPAGQDLVQVGRVGNMGLGERIFAVRFIGSNAYIVTFRQVDPLYVVDLSNPTAPYVAGELKVPGFSTYLHSVGDNLLLGVGQDATDEGRTLGAKLSLFDVADPTNPTELDTWVMPNSGSSVEWDHRAFLYWEPRSLAVLPITNWQDQFGGAVAVTVNRETGITEVGRVDNTVVDETSGPASTCDVYPSPWEDEFQICEPGEQPAKDGGECYEDEYYGRNPEEMRFIAEEFGIDPDTVVVPDNAQVFWCYPIGPGFETVSRSIIIDDDLWTLSNRSLQRNDLDTLTRQARIELSGEFWG